MKLTSTQKKIINKIIAGEVYDIPTYLQAFNKGHYRQYNKEKLKAVFDKYENDRTYIFKEENSYFYTEVYDKKGMICQKEQVPNTMTYQFKQYPISTPVKADIDYQINKESVTYKDTPYVFDFLKNNFLVADSFDDILDFITLWSYLKMESLIIEVDKPIAKTDLSIFFEQYKQDIQPDSNPTWRTKSEILGGSEDEKLPQISTQLIPYKSAQNYIDYIWKVNNEHLTMCNEFIGKRILPTPALRIYEKKRFKTVEELSNRKNLIAAWIAVAISVISILIGNILPLFQENEVDYLREIDQKLISIEKQFNETTINDDTHKELIEIKGVLNEIKKNLDNSAQKDE